MMQIIFKGLLVVLAGTGFALASEVVCENQADCPGWVALVRDLSGGQCTGFLVKKDILATNLHCIPPHLQKEKIACPQIRVAFPKTPKYESELADCSEIIHISPVRAENFLRQDFAFLRLSRSVDRPILEILQDGFPDQSDVTIYKVDPGPVSTVRKVTCKTIQKSVINPYYFNDLSQLILLADCPVIPGNSGSAILRDDKVAGIVAARHENYAPLSVKGQVGDVRLVSASGTNFNCLNTYFLGYNRGYDAECKLNLDNNSREKIVTDLYKAVEGRAIRQAQQDLKEQVEKIQYKTLPPFQIEIKSRTVRQSDSEIRRTLIEPIPTCLFPQGLPKEFPHDKIEFEIPVVEITLKFDRYYRFETSHRELKAKVTVPIHDGGLVRDRFLGVMWRNPAGLFPSEEAYSLKTCPLEN